MTQAAQENALNKLFTALADRGRRRMLDRLMRGPASASELAQFRKTALPATVKHLAVLEKSGLVRSEKAGRVRTYEVAPRGLDRLEAWVEERRGSWNAQFDRLEVLLSETAKKKGAIK